MQWQLSPYVAAVLAAAPVALLIARKVWRHRAAPGAVPLCLVMLSVAAYALAHGVQLGSRDLEMSLFWWRLTFIGGVTFPPAWFVFAMQYTRRDRRLTPRHLALLAVVPVLAAAAGWTSDLHDLYGTGFHLELGDGASTLRFTPGFGFRANLIYGYLLLMAGSIVLVEAALKAPDPYASQTRWMLLGLLVLAAAHAVYLLRLMPVAQLSGVALALTGLAWAYGLLRFRLLDLVPIAREGVFLGMVDGVIVLDGRSRVVDLNPMAEQILGRTLMRAVGRSLEELLPGQPGLARLAHETAPLRAEIALDGAGSERRFDSSLSPLRDRRGRLTGQLVVLRDITELRRAERERERLIHELRHMLAQVKTLRGLLPICASCKKIRNDKGYWEAVEVYVGTHSEVEFTHGICPDCERRFYESLEAEEGASGRG